MTVPFNQAAKVLIVEDESVVALDLQARLQSLGYIVLGPVESGPETLELIRANLPDVILMDITLRGEIDGVETAHRVRSEHDIPVIFMTGASDEGTLDRVKQTDPAGYLLKPISDRCLSIQLRLAQAASVRMRQIRYDAHWFSGAFRSLGDGLLIVDTHGRIVQINPKAERLTGWAIEEALGRPVWDLLHFVDDQLRPVADLVRHCMSEGINCVREGEVNLESRTGQHIPIDEIASPIFDRDHKLVGATLLLRDASARKEAEEQFRQEVVPMVLDTLGAMVVVLNSSGRIVRFNKASEEATGFTFSEVRGRQFWEFAADPESASEMEDAFRTIVNGRETSARHCSAWRDAFGSARQVAWAHGAILGADGEFRYDVCTGVPVAERRAP